MDIASLYQLYKAATGFTTDSRKIQPGYLYFALKGEHFDGNSFAAKALEQGAAYAIIDRSECRTDDRCILVSDVLQTMQQLGLHHRRQLPLKAVIGITGSNGKTTTKELVHAVLATTFRTHYTKGNLNNHIGIPITLLEMPEDTEIAVIEMGANHQREIASYCTYVEPTHGIITNCGKAHLEGFGGVEGIRKGKGELYDYLNEHDGFVFVNGDDDILLNMLRQRNMPSYRTYGHSPSAECRSKILIDNPFLKIAFGDITIDSHLFGSYNYSNIMCAVAVGNYFGVSDMQIKSAIEQYNPTNARSQVLQKNGYQLILDAYNANPTSMQHALESFAKSAAEKKVVILGDMFELGEYSEQEHQKIAAIAEQLQFDTIVLVGQAFSHTNTGPAVLKFGNNLETQEWFKKQHFNGAHILLKGSRSMQMEKVVE